MTELEQQLQQSLALMRAHQAPLPLLGGQAVAQAVRLRRRGLSYSAIALVMGTYHGVYKGGAAWREACRRAGVPAKHYADGTQRVPPQMRRES